MSRRQKQRSGSKTSAERRGWLPFDSRDYYGKVSPKVIIKIIPKVSTWTMSKHPRHPQKKYIAFKSIDLKDALCALNSLTKYI
jgi:hypothetical protein